MLRAILANQNTEVLRQLEKLIDWRAEGIDLIDTTDSGDRLIGQIKSLHPDLVILDTNLNGEVDWLDRNDKNGAKTAFDGMDVVEHYHPLRHYVRFIVMGDPEDYQTIKRAIRMEVLDFLKKPVAKEDLQAALRLAVDRSISHQTMETLMPAVPEFRSDSYQSGALQIPDSDDDYTEKILDACNIDFATEFGVGICIGLRPEVSEELSKINYQKFTILTLAIYSRILTFFREKNIGFEVRRTAHRIRMMGVFPQGKEKSFLEGYIQPLLDELEEQYQTKLCAGLGSYAYAKEQLLTSYRDAKYCYELYFFEQQQLLGWYEHVPKNKAVSPEVYEKNQDVVFQKILTKDPTIFETLEKSIDDIIKMHYGNWQAVIMRSMNYIGEINARLRRYKLVEEGYFSMHDELQQHLLQAMIAADVKRDLMEYFRKLIPKVYQNTRHSGKAAVEQVKTYMQENFMRDLSIKELSEVACVSINYFSHMFKNETGQNYKAYLTGIRMDHAVNLLLNSDYGLYEISDRTGYQNVRTFVDAFKQRYGLSPTKYKKKMLQGGGESSQKPSF